MVLEHVPRVVFGVLQAGHQANEGLLEFKVLLKNPVDGLIGRFNLDGTIERRILSI